jgi:hypothetical protein
MIKHLIEEVKDLALRVHQEEISTEDLANKSLEEIQEIKNELLMELSTDSLYPLFDNLY